MAFGSVSMSALLKTMELIRSDGGTLLIDTEQDAYLNGSSLSWSSRGDEGVAGDAGDRGGGEK